MKPGRDKWLKRFRESPGATMRLFCFPYAGAGASVFRKWPDGLPRNIELWALQLPGRENRFAEPASDLIGPIVEQVADAVSDLLERPFALFGHSMGALIAFELVRHLRRSGNTLPAGLLVSGQRAPQIKETSPRRCDLPEKEFLEMLGNMNGTPRDVLGNPELMEMLIPVLRADFAVCQKYVYATEPPLPCPIVAFAGRQDGEVGPDMVQLWQEQTSADFKFRIFPGDHFYFQAPEAGFLEILSQELRALSG
jgi:medium-chain acyl-[acyl-carrier-protein] hydrolase